MKDILDEQVQYLKGVGPKRSKLLAKLGMFTVRDLLFYFPKEYEDRSLVTKIASVRDSSRAIVCGKIEACDIINPSPYISIFKAAVSDGTGLIYAEFFRKTNPYHSHDLFGKISSDFAKGCCVCISGAIEIAFGEKKIKVEEYERYEPFSKDFVSIHFNRIVPIYPLTEGLSQKWLRELMFKNAVELSKHYPDIIPPQKESSFTDPSKALASMHFPATLTEAEDARKRLAFNEFLLLETALAIVRKKTAKINKKQKYEIKRNILTAFKNKLPFEFTKAQKRTINEIFSDMLRAEPMNRLLLGDVGSGKTIVALSAILLAVENSFQAAFLAPTEILAEQHYFTISQLLAGLGVKIALYTSGTNSKKKIKNELLEDISDGTFNIIVGTHALLEDTVKFKNLSLVVIDEQHRFGVLQRETMHFKSNNPDMLVMTATPIPRTLALTVYADLDISVIDEMPKGRASIKTMHLVQAPAYDLVKNEVKKGRQAYIVYPLVEESDKIELKAAVEEAAKLSSQEFANFRVGLLHGQMKSGEKEKAMLAFRDGNIDILISTTVIEVGIDVPNATVMVIEHADRFGLATLHQLRGRVGRGKHGSFCVLLGSPKTEESKRRFNVMLETTNGFRIAEEDLNIRGPGEFFGTSQHGIPNLKAGNILKDIEIIEKTKVFAETIIGIDPELNKSENHNLKLELLRLYNGKFGLSKIG